MVLIRFGIGISSALLTVGVHAQNVKLQPSPSSVPVVTQAAQRGAPVTKVAFLANVEKEFSAMDANKDKKLSKPEIEKFRRAALERQRVARSINLFNRLDADKNGYLSREEFSHLAAPIPAINVQPLMTRADANRDQQLSEEEYRASATGDFDRLDINKDGILSAAETTGVKSPAGNR
jgi:Secreted protein acidic and rich in cysteine Ca binding region.